MLSYTLSDAYEKLRHASDELKNDKDIALATVQSSYSALFENQSKYNAVMNALAGVIYREMRQQNVN